MQFDHHFISDRSDHIARSLRAGDMLALSCMIPSITIDLNPARGIGIAIGEVIFAAGTVPAVAGNGGSVADRRPARFVNAGRIAGAPQRCFIAAFVAGNQQECGQGKSGQRPG